MSRPKPPGSRVLPVGLLLASLLAAPISLASGPAGEAAADLIVVISVDQLRFDYIDRYSPWFTSRGFTRITGGGAVFSEARYRHGVAFTGPGHATIGSGLLPVEHGIVGNAWFEPDGPTDIRKWAWYFDDITPFHPDGEKRSAFVADGTWWWKQGGSPRYCAEDERVRATAGATGGMSPVALAETGLGDALKLRYPDARVVSVAIKDRAAILMGGRAADAAYWFDYKLPGFISSTYYRYDPRAFSFNTSVPGYVPGSALWRPSPFIPEAERRAATYDPEAAWPLKNNTYGGTFPHPIPHTKGFTYTPFAHEMLLDFALHVATLADLGSRRGTPDLLFVGISSTDYLGHYYGPDSMEVADSMVRLDRSLGAFLDALLRRTGGRMTVVLTADHGVQPNPEIEKLRHPKADTGRLDLRLPEPDARFIYELPRARIAVERMLAKRLGIPFSESAPLENALIFFFEEPSLYLNWRRIHELRLDGARVRRALRDVLESMKSDGIADAWTSADLLTPNPRASRTEQLMRASFRSDRSGDVLVALRPGWIWTWGTNSTTHGQPVENDLHVPLMFWGAGITPGRYDGDASPADIARTLGALLGFDAGGRESHVLPCVRD